MSKEDDALVNEYEVALYYVSVYVYDTIIVLSLFTLSVLRIPQPLDHN